MLKKISIPCLKILISIALISFLFHKLGFINVLDQILSVKLYWFCVGIIMFTISNFLGSYQWYILLKLKNFDIAFKKVISYYFVGLFFNNFLRGFVGGDAFRIYDISKANGKNSDVVSTVFFDRFIGFAVLITIALVTAIYWSKKIASTSILIIISVIFLIWVIIFTLLFKEKLLSSISFIFKKILPTQITAKIKEIYLGINTFKHHKKELLYIIFISFIIQSLRILVHYAAARSIGVNISIIYFIIFIPIVALIASLPISIGGIGVREISAIPLFSTIWNVQADIAAFELLAYLISIISAIPGGIIFMFRSEENRKILKGNQ